MPQFLPAHSPLHYCYEEILGSGPQVSSRRWLEMKQKIGDTPFNGEKNHYLVPSPKKSYTYWIYSPLSFFLHSWHRNHFTAHIPAKLKLPCPVVSQDPFREQKVSRWQHSFQSCTSCLSGLALWNLTLRWVFGNPAQGTKPTLDLL